MPKGQGTVEIEGSEMDLPTENVAAVVGEGLHLDECIKGMRVDVLVDTGATVFLLFDKVVEQWSKSDKELVINTDIIVLLADNMALTVAGEVEAELQLAGGGCSTSIYCCFDRQ